MKPITPELIERRKLAFKELEKQFTTLTEMAAYFGVSVPAIIKWKSLAFLKAECPI